jgi:natural product biosynthesis luciferase-like monooxygenase protein
MQFSVLFFSQAETQHSRVGRYELVTASARYCDKQGFTAVWLPERHFDPMGGIYPNPAVIAAALAPQTCDIRLRAGSVVLPLHHPAEVVESWAVVDNLSGGRVDMAFASGWNANDFVLSPQTFDHLREEWLRRIPVVQSLWEGNAQRFVNGKGDTVDVRTYPRPIQSRLQTWLAISRKIESFDIAGRMGANVLTMLSGITLMQLAERIEVYRKARAEAGHDRNGGVITLMLHTFVHRDIEHVMKVVREPLLQYIKTSAVSHIQGGAVSAGRTLSSSELDRMAEYSLERYVKTGALLGDVASTRRIVGQLASIGVGEIACMVDFGPTAEQVLESLTYLTQLMNESQKIEA